MTSSIRLADLVEDVQSGFACGESVDDGVVQLRMNNVDTEGGLSLTTMRRVPRDAVRDLDKFVLAAGDVLFNNTNSPELVGKSAVFRGFDEPVVFSNHFTRIRVRQALLDPRYLGRWFAAEWRKGRFALMCNQWVNQAAVKKDALLAMEIPVRPLPEQRRIADILDKADAIRRKRKEAIALTEELLRSAFLEMFGDPVTNPKGWEVKPLGELLSEIESGWSPTCLQRPAAVGEWGVLKLGAVTSGRYVQTENKVLGPEHEPVPSLEVKPGDVLFARKNTYEHVAACVLVDRTQPKLMMSDLVFRLVLREDAGLDSAVLWAMLSHPVKRRQVQALAGGTAGSMPNISKERLRTVVLPIPAVSLQQRFRRILDGCGALRDRAIEAMRTSDTLFDSLVHRAFRGELTGTNGAGKPQLGLFEGKEAG